MTLGFYFSGSVVHLVLGPSLAVWGLPVGLCTPELHTFPEASKIGNAPSSGGHEAGRAQGRRHQALRLPTPIPTPTDKVNRESVNSIQKSIFTVCLDKPVPRVSDDVYRNHVAGQMLHGGGSKLNSGNRWFDKTLQASEDQARPWPQSLVHWGCELSAPSLGPASPASYL